MSVYLEYLLLQEYLLTKIDFLISVQSHTPDPATHFYDDIVVSLIT